MGRGGISIMAFILDTELEKITFGVVADATHDAVALALADKFGVSEHFNEDFSSYLTQIEADAAWLPQDSPDNGVNITNDNYDFTIKRDGTNISTSFDLGAPLSNTAWVLRCKVTIASPLVITSTLSSGMNISVSSTDSTTGLGFEDDLISMGLINTIVGGGRQHSVNWLDGGSGTSSATGSTTAFSAGETIYMELKRENPLLIRSTIYTDASYTAVRDTITKPIGVLDVVNGLRYIKIGTATDVTGWNGTFTGTIDDIQIWNGTSVPILNNNWRVRVKLDLTNLDDGANAVDKRLYMLMSAKDGASDANDLQDSLGLLLRHDNAISDFSIIDTEDSTPASATPDNTFVTAPSASTFFVELRRTTNTTYQASLFPDGTFTGVPTETQTGTLPIFPASVTGLRYLKFMNDVTLTGAGAIDGTIDDLNHTDLATSEDQEKELFLVDGVLKKVGQTEGFIVDAIFPNTVAKDFTIDSLVRARTCSPWLKFSEADGSSARVTINQGDGQGYEIPQVTVPTQVTGIKCSVNSVSSQGAVSMKIVLQPASQLAQGNFAQIANGQSTNQVNMSGLSGTFVDFTFLFSGPILEPNTRYMVVFNDQIDNSPGMNYKTILTSTRDYHRYAVLFQDPGAGTPPKYNRVVATNRALAADIQVVNQSTQVCPLIDAFLVDEGTWQFREQRWSNANLVPSPNYTLTTEPTRLRVTSQVGSQGNGWIFKSFKKTDIDGSDITIEGDSDDFPGHSIRIRVYDGKYQRDRFGDFEQAGSIADPVVPLKGIGLLGSIQVNPLSTSLTLPAGSINYAGSTEEFITVFILNRDSGTANANNLDISKITVSMILVWNFVNPTVVTEDTTTGGGETDWGYTRASSTAGVFQTKDFSIDACVGFFAGRRSRVGDIIILCLRAFPNSTGQEVVDHVNDFTKNNGLSFVGTTSRVKNWMGFLERKGFIQEDNSNPDWYKTKWISLV